MRARFWRGSRRRGWRFASSRSEKALTASVCTAGGRRSAEPTFVEIAQPISGVGIEVVLRSGHVLRVPAGFEAETVRQLVATLGDEASPC